MSEARKLLEECKQILAEVKDLIRFLESMSSEETLVRLKNLPPKEKDLLIGMIRYGEISRWTRSVVEKTPSYIS